MAPDSLERLGVAVPRSTVPEAPLLPVELEPCSGLEEFEREGALEFRPSVEVPTEREGVFCCDG